jgi:CubicO group peptidase (beta-lactamase class C family)
MLRTKTTVYSLALLAILVFFVPKLSAQIDVLDDVLFAHKVDSVAQMQRIQQEIIGMAVCIVKDGKIIYSQGYGYSNWEKLIPVTPATTFRWASMSKSLTAITALKLNEEHHIELDSTVTYYNPALPYRQVHIRDLLQNRSGIGHYDEMTRDYPQWRINLKNYPGAGPFNSKAAVRIFDNAPLNFTPGQKFLYSTFGFVVAGEVIDTIGRRVFGKGYLDLVNEHIRKPLGMTSLQPDYQFENNPLKTEGYYYGGDNEIVRRPDDEVSWKLAGGGFESNVVDLGHYIRGLMLKEILQPSSYDLLWKKQPDAEYGYGFSVEGDNLNLRIGHSGTQTKTRTIFWMYPNRRVGVGVMLNSEWGDPGIVADHLLQLLGVNTEPRKYEPRCIDNPKSSTQYAAIWKAGSYSQVMRRGYMTQHFQAETDHLRAHGFQLTDVETYLDKKNVRHWDGVFEANNETFVWEHQMDPDSFYARNAGLAREGWHLQDAETYIVSNKRKWTGVYARAAEKSTFINDLDADAFDKQVRLLARRGLRLNDFESYYDAEQKKRLWAGIFTPGGDSYGFWRSLSMDAFNQKLTDLNKEGLKLIDIEIYNLNGKQFWSGVWRGGNFDIRLQRNVSFCPIMKNFINLGQNGYDLLDWERY